MICNVQCDALKALIFLLLIQDKDCHIPIQRMSQEEANCDQIGFLGQGNSYVVMMLRGKRIFLR